MTLISVIAEHPLPGVMCPKSVRRELAANETVYHYRVAAAKAPNDPASALRWKISPPVEQQQQLRSPNGYGQADDVVELTPGKYKFSYMNVGNGVSRRSSSTPSSSCQFTVEIEGKQFGFNYETVPGRFSGITHSLMCVHYHNFVRGS